MTLAASRRITLVRCGALLSQHHVSTLLNFLHDSGHQVQLVSIQCPADELEAFRALHPGIAMTGLGTFGGRGVGRFMRGGAALRKALKAADADVHYVVDSWTLRYYAVATALPMGARRPALVYHTFDMLSPGVAAWFERSLERRVARQADLVVVTDSARAALMKALYGLSAVPLPLAVRMPRAFVPPDEAARAASRQATLPPGCDRLVISPTQLSPARKGLEIIRGFAETPDNFALVTYEGSTDYTRACRDLAAQLGLADRVVILPETSNAEVVLATAAADVALVFHDENESLGNFFCHPSRLAYCAAAGIPVVANAVPSIEAVVYRHGLGACVSLSDEGRFAEALVALCADQARLDAMKASIRERFAAHLCFEVEGAVLDTALRQLKVSAHG